MNPAKTKLGLSEVEYVGHVVAATGNSFTVDIVNGCAPDALLKNSFSILRVVSMARYLHLKTQEIHEALQKAHKVIGLAKIIPERPADEVDYQAATDRPGLIEQDALTSTAAQAERARAAEHNNIELRVQLTLAQAQSSPTTP